MRPLRTSARLKWASFLVGANRSALSRSFNAGSKSIMSCVRSATHTGTQRQEGLGTIRCLLESRSSLPRAGLVGPGAHPVDAAANDKHVHVGGSGDVRGRHQARRLVILPCTRSFPFTAAVVVDQYV